MAVSRALRRRIIQRASDCCEYCQMPRDFDVAHFEIDHIRPQVHDGPTTAENLAWSCFPCNNHKGPNLSGIDPETNQIERLFHPRKDVWHDHFEWEGPRLVGKTPVGSATIATLAINTLGRIVFRQELIDEGVFPPIPSPNPLRGKEA